MNDKINNDEVRMPLLVQVLLTPDKKVYGQCSGYTRNNFKTLSKVIAFTVSVCGTILAVSISKFVFGGSPASLVLTLPFGILLYWYLDRMVIMADTKDDPQFIRRSRYFIAVILGLFNSLLIDGCFYAADVKAEINVEVAAKQLVIQQTADSLKGVAQAHIVYIYHQIDSAAGHLRERNNELVQEVEGSAYSHHSGKGVVYDEKKAVLDRETSDFERNKRLLMAEAAKDEATIAEINADAARQKKQIASQVSMGFNHTLELLHLVVMRKPFNMFVAFLFLAVAMVLELLPMLAKKYIDISEYFEHAAYHIAAHLATAEMKKNQIIEQEQHRTDLLNYRVKEAELARHAVETFKQKMAHHERIVNATANYFATIAEKEADLKTRFSDYYPEHISPIFQNLLTRFHTDQQQAFEPSMPTPTQEVPNEF